MFHIVIDENFHRVDTGCIANPVHNVNTVMHHYVLAFLVESLGQRLATCYLEVFTKIQHNLAPLMLPHPGDDPSKPLYTVASNSVNVGTMILTEWIADRDNTSFLQ